MLSSSPFSTAPAADSQWRAAWAVGPCHRQLPASRLKAQLRPLGSSAVDLTLGAVLSADPGLMALALTGPSALASDGAPARVDASPERDPGAAAGASVAAVRSVLATLGAAGLASALPDDVLADTLRSADGDTSAAAVMLVSSFS